MVTGAARGKKALGELGLASTKTGRAFEQLTKGSGLLAAAFGALIAIGVVSFFSSAIRAAGAFETKMSEISTLVDTTTFSMDKLEKALKNQAIQFGAIPVDQAAAAYQIISAGAGSAQEAIDLLSASNKLAVGGVTNVAVAADGLTTVLNAYGDQVEGATAVSDALFVAMRAGKTTIAELSGSIGKVAPLAAQAGVSFDELLASVSALTKGGISTREAFTGVRAIMAAIVKPTSEATALAKKLKFEFTAASLKTKGFAQFMKELVTATEGSTEQMALLFGGVEALVPALALAGKAGEDMTAILEDMVNKGGLTQEAFEKMTNTFEFQSARVKAGITVALINLGDVIAKILTPALKFIADNFEVIGKAALALTAIIATKLAISIGTTLVAAINVAITRMIVFGSVLGKTSVAAALLRGTLKTVIVAFKALTLVFRASPFGLLVTAISLAVGALVFFRDTSDNSTEAIDKVTASITDEITQITALSTLLGEATILTTEQAMQKLNEALARRENITAMIVERSELIKQGDEYKTLQSKIEEVQALINTALQSQGENDPFATATVTIDFFITKLEELQREQDALNAGSDEYSEALAMNKANIDKIRAALENARGGQVRFNEAVDTGTGFANRLKEAIDALGPSATAAQKRIVALAVAFTPAIQAAGRLLGIIGQIGASLPGIAGIAAAFDGVGETIAGAFAPAVNKLKELFELGKIVGPGVAAAIDPIKSSAGGAASAVDELADSMKNFTEGIDTEFASILAANGGAQDQVRAWFAEQKMMLQELGLEYSDYAGKLETIFNERMAQAYKTDLANATDWRSGIERAVQGLGESIGNEADLAETALTSLFNNAANAISEFAKTGKLDFKKFAQSVAADILALTTKMLLLRALKGILGGFSGGGSVPSFADGGKVRGPGTTTSDSIPALLSREEFVVNAKSAKQFGPLLEAINSGNFSELSDGGLSNEQQSLAPGPQESAEAGSSMSQQQAPSQIQVISSITDGDVVKAFDNDAGERVIINMLERNKNAVVGLLNG